MRLVRFLPSLLCLAACATTHAPATVTQQTAPHQYDVRVEGYPQVITEDLNRAFGERAQEACARDGRSRYEVVQINEAPAAYAVQPREQAGTVVVTPEAAPSGAPDTTQQTERPAIDAVIVCR